MIEPRIKKTGQAYIVVYEWESSTGEFFQREKVFNRGVNHQAFRKAQEFKRELTDKKSD